MRKGPARQRRLTAALATSLALATSACAFGPRILPTTSAEYGRALHHAANEQILTHLLQLRNREPMTMIDLTQIVSQFRVEAAGSVGGTYQSGSSQFPVSLSGGIRETPTMTYVPVTGRSFAIRMLSPIGLYQIFLLSRSGWDLRRLLTACVDEVNGLENVSTSVGFAPKPRPGTLRAFQRMAVLMQHLEVADVLETQIVGSGRARSTALSGSSSTDLKDIRFELVFQEKIEDRELAAKAAELKHLLHLDPSSNRFPIVATLEEFSWDEQTIRVQTRSLLGVMLFLAGHIDPQGAQPLSANGNGLTSPIFDVHVTAERPERAAVAVEDRGRWFWIAEDDTNTKATFSLLGYLVRLQQAREGGDSKGVLLTLPTG